MSKRKNRSRPPLNVAEILRISDDRQALNELDTRIWCRSFDELNQLKTAEREYIALWWLKGDTLNGGLDQYFFNDSGNLALTALDGLSRIGEVAAHRLLTEAISLFDPTPYPTERYHRQSVLLSFDETKENRIDQLTRELDKLFENMDKKLILFFRQHPEEYE